MLSDHELTSAVYGELYQSAKVQIQLVEEAIKQHTGVGFDTEEACAKWAHDNLLDVLAYSPSHKMFFHVSHYGELLTKAAYADYYCNDILFIWEQNGKHASSRKWIPDGFEYKNKAKLFGEVGSGIREPLHHRDYFTPTGFFDMARGTFNIAKPFPVPAKATGRDTSHIYTYIEHIAGECAPWLLAWLRWKMCYPTVKTHVTPIIISREQGTGKSTFAEVICKGLFGADNVLVTDQHDTQARFNADSADALIISLEEKQYEDSRNPSNAIKSRVTATHIRKELKGIDPVYQETYTEYIMTTNNEVPIKFEDANDQRRFMVMEADGNFTRKKNPLADEVFTKLYGYDEDHVKHGVPFVDDPELIAQFKHELYSDKALADVQLRRFPHTAAYKRCYTLPRTTENTDIVSILRSLAPFIKASLEQDKVVTTVTENGETLKLDNFIASTAALQWIPAAHGLPAHVAICRPIIFVDGSTGKPYAHATVERTLYDCDSWLVKDYGLRLIPDMEPLLGGFFGIQNRFRNAPAARFQLAGAINTDQGIQPTHIDRAVFSGVTEEPGRIGKRLRVNSKWRPDPDGEYETVNELKPDITTLDNKNNNCQYLDTFLLEADETTQNIYRIEMDRMRGKKEIRAEALFNERLKIQRAEADRMYNAGTVCRLVYSGGKSIHMLVRVKDAPETVDEYKWLHGHLCTQLGDRLTFDPVVSDPGRLTRAPITFERTYEYNGIIVHGTQLHIVTNWHNILDVTWRPLYEQWLNRPLMPYEQHGRRLMPTKPEYKEAMLALLHGTFWTDRQWNGRRQQCFFPGYRLCRLLGYSHDQLWGDEGILDGVDSYYRHNEIAYWKTRESCDLIAKIDREVSDYDEECAKDQ